MSKKKEFQLAVLQAQNAVLARKLELMRDQIDEIANGLECCEQVLDDPKFGDEFEDARQVFVSLEFHVPTRITRALIEEGIVEMLARAPQCWDVLLLDLTDTKK